MLKGFAANLSSILACPPRSQSLRCQLDSGEKIDMGKRRGRDSRRSPTGTGDGAHKDRAVVRRAGESQRPLQRLDEARRCAHEVHCSLKYVRSEPAVVPRPFTTSEAP